MQRQKLEEGTRLLNTSAVFLSAGRSTPRGSIPEEVLSENVSTVPKLQAHQRRQTALQLMLQLIVSMMRDYIFTLDA